MADVKFGLAQINNATPKLWGRISSSIRYFAVSAIALFSAADFIPQAKQKWIIFGTSMFILLLKAIDMGLGVQESDTPPTQGQ